eukprot:Rmarinus@m.11894
MKISSRNPRGGTGILFDIRSEAKAVKPNSTLLFLVDGHILLRRTKPAFSLDVRVARPLHKATLVIKAPATRMVYPLDLLVMRTGEARGTISFLASKVLRYLALYLVRRRLLRRDQLRQVEGLNLLLTGMTILRRRLANLVFTLVLNMELVETVAQEVGNSNLV